MKALGVLKFFKEIDEWVKWCLSFPSRKSIDEAIAELEALQQPRSCLTCKHWGKSISGYFSGRICNKMVCSPHNKENYTDSNFGCNLFEPKEQ